MNLDILYKLWFNISYPWYFNPNKEVIEKSIKYYIDEWIDIMKEYSILYMISEDDYLCEEYQNIFQSYIDWKSIRYKHDTLHHSNIIDIWNKCVNHIKEKNTYNYRRKQASRKTSNKKFREKIFLSKWYNCSKCWSNKDITIDHIVPVKKWWSDEINNLQIMCRSCNSSKWCSL